MIRHCQLWVFNKIMYFWNPNNFINDKSVRKYIYFYNTYAEQCHMISLVIYHIMWISWWHFPSSTAFIFFLLNRNQWNIFYVLSWINILCSIERYFGVVFVFSRVTIWRKWAWLEYLWWAARWYWNGKWWGKTWALCWVPWSMYNIALLVSWQVSFPQFQRCW